MSDANVILALAKVIIAAAWADGDLSHEEINSLKDLILRLTHVSATVEGLNARQWAVLDIYMASPVDAAERARLIEELQNKLVTSEHKKLALAGLEDMLQADGEVSDEERAVLAEIKTAIESLTPGLLGQLGRLVKGAVERRSEAVADAPNREALLEDFIKNKIYYSLRRRLQLDQTDELDIPEEELRKLSLAGGLMARVAHVDREVTEAEFETMVAVLQQDWEISREAAAFVAEVAISEVAEDLDFYRLTRQFFESTSREERIRFLDVLFDVANADGHVSYAELDEIRLIARGINLTRRRVSEAKAKLRDKREMA